MNKFPGCFGGVILVVPLLSVNDKYFIFISFSKAISDSFGSEDLITGIKLTDKGIPFSILASYDTVKIVELFSTESSTGIFFRVKELFFFFHLF